MKDDAKEARKAYLREWRRKNRDRVKIYNEKYWEKRAKEGRHENNGNS